MFIKTIGEDLFEKLIRVEPSVADDIRRIEYRPCKITLLDGRSFDRVYVQNANPFRLYWGNWPDEDQGKKFLLIENIGNIEESPVRLPANLANKMYKAGESSMGGCVFTLVLNNGKKLTYSTGNVVDFLNLPPGVNPNMIKDLLPHVGKEVFRDRLPREFERGAEYFWCLYADPKIHGHKPFGGFDTKGTNC